MTNKVGGEVWGSYSAAFNKCDYTHRKYRTQIRTHVDIITAPFDSNVMARFPCSNTIKFQIVHTQLQEMIFARVIVNFFMLLLKEVVIQSFILNNNNCILQLSG
jgi:hypothetical protein